LTKKTTKTKRQLRGTAMVNERDMASVAKMLPYA
jgi:ribosomal protein L35